MRFEPLDGSGLFLVRLDVRRDVRGAFARVWCADDFARAGIAFRPVQANCSTTARRGTVRGMHLQRAPQGDSKLVRVTMGRVHDVVFDLRPDSPTLGRAFSVLLAEEDDTALFVPAGFAHGFQALTDAVTVEYLHGEAPFSPSHYDGFSPIDPDAAIEWPEPITLISEKDRGYPPLGPRLATLFAGGAV